MRPEHARRTARRRGPCSYRETPTLLATHPRSFQRLSGLPGLLRRETLGRAAHRGSPRGIGQPRGSLHREHGTRAVLGAVTRARAGLDSGKGSHFVGSPRGSESSNHSAPRPLPCAGSRVASESRGGEPARGRGLCCPVLGGRASARHTGQLSWDVSLQRWDSPPPRDRAIPAHAARVSPARSCCGASPSCWG